MFENRIVVKPKLFVRTFYFDDMVGKVKSSATPCENIRHIVMIWLVRAWHHRYDRGNERVGYIRSCDNRCHRWHCFL